MAEEERIGRGIMSILKVEEREGKAQAKGEDRMVEREGEKGEGKELGGR